MFYIYVLTHSCMPSHPLSPSPFPLLHSIVPQPSLPLPPLCTLLTCPLSVPFLLIDLLHN